MKKRYLSIVGIFVLCFAFSISASYADKWIIDSKNGVLPNDLAEHIEEAGGKLLKTWGVIGMALAEFATEDDALTMERGGLTVMPDVRINWLPDDEELGLAHIGEDESLYGYQWYLPMIEADLAWDEGVTGAGVRVAVLDTGIWYSHADLDDNIDFSSSASFVAGLPDYLDDHGHGTHVAGIIAAEDNAFGTIGVAPNATLIAVKVVDQSGSGDWSWIMDGVIHAVQEDADIINMSLRGILPKGQYAAPLWASMTKLMNWAAMNDVLVITAAGNDGYNFNHSWNLAVIPAEAGNGISIAATGPTDMPAYYTNHGSSLVWVAAPGGDFSYGSLGGIFSTYYEPPGAPPGYHWYTLMEGTSMAAPCAAGVAALIIEQYGPMNVGRLKNHLAQTADYSKDWIGLRDYYGRGRVNAYRAVTKK